MRWLPSLEIKGAEIEGTRRGAAGPNYVLKGQPYQIAWDTPRMVKEAYSRTILVYRCIDAIASDECSLPIRRRRITHAEQDPSEGQIVNDPVLTRVWNRRPNVFETSDVLRYRISTLLFLSKQGVPVEKLRNASGKVVGAVILPVGRTFPVPGDPEDPDPQLRFIHHWEVRMPDGTVSDVSAKDVVWFKRPHPDDPYSSMTPLEAMGLSVDMAFYARLYNRNFMANDGRPGGILSVRGDLDVDDALELKSRFAGGPGFAGKTTVIEADDVTWVDTATTPRDAQYVQTLEHSDTDIMRGFGVHQGRLGDNSGRTFDNADADEENYWRTTMRNHCRLISSSLDADPDFGGSWDDDEWIRHDMTSIAVLQRQEHAAAVRDQTEVDKGLMTPDEYRERRGRGTFDQPKTKSLWIPKRELVAPDDATQKQVDETTSLPTQPTPQQGVGPAPDAAVRTRTPEGEPNLRLVKDLEQAFATMPPEHKADFLAALLTQTVVTQYAPRELAPPSVKELPTADDEEPSREVKGPATAQEFAENVMTEYERLMGEAEVTAEELAARAKERDEARERLRAEARKRLLAYEEDLREVLLSLDRAQEGAVLAKLGGAKQRKGTRHWQTKEGEATPAELKALPYDAILAPLRWLREATDALRPVIERIGAETARRVGREVGEDLALNSPGIRQIVDQQVAELVDVTQRRMRKIRERIEKDDAEGKSIEQITEGVKEIYAGRRGWADKAARNGVAPCVNGVSFAAAREAGADWAGWLSSRDESVRDSHEKADGQTRSLHDDEPFIVGGARLRWPGDRTAPIGQWINCRCTLLFDKGDVRPEEWKAAGFELETKAARYARWDPSKHPRHPKGSGRQSGRFLSTAELEAIGFSAVEPGGREFALNPKGRGGGFLSHGGGNHTHYHADGTATSHRHGGGSSPHKHAAGEEGSHTTNPLSTTRPGVPPRVTVPVPSTEAAPPTAALQQAGDALRARIKAKRSLSLRDKQRMVRLVDQAQAGEEDRLHLLQIDLGGDEQIGVLVRQLREARKAPAVAATERPVQAPTPDPTPAPFVPPAAPSGDSRSFDDRRAAVRRASAELQQAEQRRRHAESIGAPGAYQSAQAALRRAQVEQEVAIRGAGPERPRPVSIGLTAKQEELLRALTPGDDPMEAEGLLRLEAQGRKGKISDRESQGLIALAERRAAQTSGAEARALTTAATWIRAEREKAGLTAPAATPPADMAAVERGRDAITAWARSLTDDQLVDAHVAARDGISPAAASEGPILMDEMRRRRAIEAALANPKPDTARAKGNGKANPAPVATLETGPHPGADPLVTYEARGGRGPLNGGYSVGQRVLIWDDNLFRTATVVGNPERYGIRADGSRYDKGEDHGARSLDLRLDEPRYSGGKLEAFEHISLVTPLGPGGVPPEPRPTRPLAENVNSFGDLQVEDLGLDPQLTKQLRRLVTKKQIRLDTKKQMENGETSDTMVQLGYAKHVAMQSIGRGLGYDEETIVAAQSAIENAWRDWRTTGDLSESRIALHTAMENIRRGAAPIDDLERGLLMQKAWQDATWNAKYGDAEVPIDRFIQGSYAERLHAQLLARPDSYEISQWPMSSWATQDASGLVQSNFIGRDTYAMKMSTTATREQAWLNVWSEAGFRTFGLKAPGEIVVDDSLPLNAERVKVEVFEGGESKWGAASGYQSRSAHAQAAILRDNPEATADQLSAALQLSFGQLASELWGFERESHGWWQRLAEPPSDYDRQRAERESPEDAARDYSSTNKIKGHEATLAKAKKFLAIVQRDGVEADSLELLATHNDKAAWWGKDAALDAMGYEPTMFGDEARYADAGGWEAEKKRRLEVAIRYRDEHVETLVAMTAALGRPKPRQWFLDRLMDPEGRAIPYDWKKKGT